MLDILEFKPVFDKVNNRVIRPVAKGFNKQGGCYIIKENNVIVYVGMSKSCVVKAMYRHFYKWTDNPYRVTYEKEVENKIYTAAIIVCSAEQAGKLEQGLVLALNPRDNKDRFERVLDELIEARGYSKEQIKQVNKNDIIINTDYDYDDEQGLPF